MYLIEKNGERQFVSDLDGYEGWGVIGDAAPKDGCDLIDGVWVKNHDAASDIQSREFETMPREDLIAWIQILESRLDTIEDKVNGV